MEDTPAPPGAQAGDMGAEVRRERLKSVFLTARQCTACPQLASARTQVVFGGGNADADLMLVGEAPSAREDEQGIPFVGAAGKLVDELLSSAGLTRGEVFVTGVLKCRPPGNREPTQAELDRCRPFLDEQIALVRPRVIATLGTFATRLLREESGAINELHGRPEIRTVGGVAVRLLPLYHPAAALYTRALLDTLRDDFAAVPELLALPICRSPSPRLWWSRTPRPAPIPSPAVWEKRRKRPLRAHRMRERMRWTRSPNVRRTARPPPHQTSSTCSEGPATAPGARPAAGVWPDPRP